MKIFVNILGFLVQDKFKNNKNKIPFQLTGYDMTKIFLILSVLIKKYLLRILKN